MTKEVRVVASQVVYYSYFIDVPDNVDVEDYVYSTLRSGLEDPSQIYDDGEITVEDIREYK